MNETNKVTCAKLTNLIHGMYVWGTDLSFNVVNLFYDLMIHRPSSDMRLVTWCLVIKEDCHLSDGSVWSTLLCE